MRVKSQAIFLRIRGEVFMRQVKVWPHVTLVALLCALVSGAAAALWMRHQRNNEAPTLNSAARIERVDGEVGINRDVKDGTDAQWLQATTNTPVSAGERIYARDKPRASVAFAGGNLPRPHPPPPLQLDDPPPGR